MVYLLIFIVLKIGFLYVLELYDNVDGMDVIAGTILSLQAFTCMSLPLAKVFQGYFPE